MSAPSATETRKETEVSFLVFLLTHITLQRGHSPEPCRKVSSFIQIALYVEVSCRANGFCPLQQGWRLRVLKLVVIGC
jgi:hypothetical protein